MSSQHSADANGLHGKAIVVFCKFFCILKTNTNLIIYSAVYLYVFVIYEGYVRKNINIWYMMYHFLASRFLKIHI